VKRVCAFMLTYMCVCVYKQEIHFVGRLALMWKKCSNQNFQAMSLVRDITWLLSPNDEVILHTDLCPVGALTSKPYSFTARPWELRFVILYVPSLL